VETICRLSLVAPTRVHKAGFHPTSVFGALAAAAGASATIGLDASGIARALGIAGSMAGGIIEYLADGSWTKRLHAGWAAQSGIRAALLARAGFLGPLSVFEGTHGLFHGFARGADGDYGQLTDGFGTRWLMETLAFKPYACGTMAQPYVDCAIRLARRSIAAEAIEEIVCEVAEGTVHRLWEPLAAKQAPPNAYGAKFSTPFCIAAGFILPDDHVDVILTRRDKAAEKLIGVEKIVSEAILRNVRVLAIDQAVEEKAGQKVVVGKTATLELNPDQAETLAMSRQLGTLSLALRSLVDSQSSTVEGGDDDDRRGPMNTVRYGVSTLSLSH